MIEIVPTSGFRKAFKRKVRGNKILETRFRHRIALFQSNPFDPRLKTHQLSGRLQGLWSFSVATTTSESSFHSSKQIRRYLCTLELMKKSIDRKPTLIRRVLLV